ncbi:putative F-box/LRR-repeat protein 23 [Salvia hispanica]|uniref:putative F-box/LRR-repeat protein 23 n=1 Tax=Salvia hispanica TaxID=49212 RepID=UPI0020098635|nr:putative F-box/LRR-repeat protein 23 [Salvia hispanica]
MSNSYSPKPTFPAFPPSPFTPPFDELFSLYHFTPLKNNPHVLPLPRSITRFPSPRPSPLFFITINPPHFGSFQGPPIPKFDGNDPPAGCLNHIYDFFEFYGTPLHEQARLLRICWSGNASRWLQWMRANVLLHQTKIPVVASSSSAPWIELPGDVTANILQRLGAEGVLKSAQKVCITWWKVSKDPDLWRVIDFSNPRQGVFNDEYNVMCRRAVDRSQGQLVDLTIQYFGDDALLDYIVQRSPNLKRLKLGTCFFISGYGARRTIAKLGVLEELHLTIRPGIDVSDIEVIGKACPMLKSFSCNGFNIFSFLHIGLEIKDLKPSLMVAHALNHLTSEDVFISIFKGIWEKDVVNKLKILNSLMTRSVMYHGPIAMEAIRLVLLHSGLNFTYTTIIQLIMTVLTTTSVDGKCIFSIDF